MADIKPFPVERPPEFLIGPFEEWRVQIEGRIIPRLTARHGHGDRIWLILDNRFGLECPDKGAAYQTATFVAQALAIGAGYTHLGAEKKEHPFAPLGSEIAL